MSASVSSISRNAVRLAVSVMTAPSWSAAVGLRRLVCGGRSARRILSRSGLVRGPAPLLAAALEHAVEQALGEVLGVVERVDGPGELARIPDAAPDAVVQVVTARDREHDGLVRGAVRRRERVEARLRAIGGRRERLGQRALE